MDVKSVNSVQERFFLSLLHNPFHENKDKINLKFTEINVLQNFHKCKISVYLHML